tara:strand:+ start:38 stop:937 length:900 start_codon:yes stop_codon:yes gene_type:complete
MEKRRKIKVKAATSDKKVSKLILHEKFLVKKKFILSEKYLIEKKLRPVENVIDFKNTSESNLEIRNVSKILDNKPIIKNISLSVEPGKIVGLLGPNGCGKTTLYNLIVGKYSVDKGDILLNNKKIQDLPIYQRSRMGISLLEQHRGLLNNLTAFENLCAILELYINDKDKIYKRANELLAKFNLDYLKNVRAKNLSGGEYRKCGILQRICNKNISILLLDEPCAALDLISVNSLKQFILELRKSGISILITDHNYFLIEDILDKVYIMKQGQIITSGTTKQIEKDEKAIKYYLGQKISN